MDMYHQQQRSPADVVLCTASVDFIDASSPVPCTVPFCAPGPADDGSSPGTIVRETRQLPVFSLRGLGLDSWARMGMMLRPCRALSLADLHNRRVLAHKVELVGAALRLSLRFQVAKPLSVLVRRQGFVREFERIGTDHRFPLDVTDQPRLNTLAGIKYSKADCEHEIAQLMGDARLEILTNNYEWQVIHVMQPLKEAIVRWPLALCASNSYSYSADTAATDVVSGTHKVGDYRALYYQEGQAWYYVPEQCLEDQLVWRAASNEDADLPESQTLSVPTAWFKHSNADAVPEEVIVMRFVIWRPKQQRKIYV